MLSSMMTPSYNPSVPCKLPILLYKPIRHSIATDNIILWHLEIITKLRENHMQEGSYSFNLLVIPTAHNQLWSVKDWNCIHTTLDDRWSDTMWLNVGIPYLHLRDAIASSTIELA
jgi:hypothetical protein